MSADLFAENSALAREAADPSRRSEFRVPPWPGSGGGEWAYFAGNSLGLQPRAAAGAIEEELEAWAGLAVEGWFEGERPWLTSADELRPALGRMVGAAADEVVAMNTLTVNLHLLMSTFYRPAAERFRIVIEDAAFPSDSHAVASQVRHHGLDPTAAVVRLRPREGEAALRTEDITAELERLDGSVALVLLGGVNYLTGELLDIPAVTAAAHEAGAVVGWDLAHAVGNVPLELTAWGVDWAA
jgi:kynureninase